MKILLPPEGAEVTLFVEGMAETVSNNEFHIRDGSVIGIYIMLHNYKLAVVVRAGGNVEITVPQCMGNGELLLIAKGYRANKLEKVLLGMQKCNIAYESIPDKTWKQLELILECKPQLKTENIIKQMQVYSGKTTHTGR